MTQNTYAAELRNSLLNETLLWLGILSLPMLAMSMARISTMGWRPVFAIHLILVALIWAAWFLRRNIVYGWRAGIVLLGLGASGLGGYLQHGPAAIAGQFLLLFLVVAALFLEGRAVFRLTLVIVIGMILTAFGAMFGILDFRIDYPTYTRDPSTWGLLIFATAGYGGAIAALAWRLFDRLVAHEALLTEANAELEKRSRELELANRIKGDILSNLGHEFRTPLNGILGMSELLLSSEIDPEQRSWTDILNSSAKHLARMLERMLDFVELGEAGTVLQDDPFNLPEIIGIALQRVNAAAAAKGLTLSVELDPSVPELLQGDARRLKQILTELLDNAVNFTRKGRVAISARRIEATPGDDRCWIELEISDTGCGIPAEHHEFVFQPLTQIDTSYTRDVGGNGLGLAIVRRIVGLMAGRVSLSSTPGEGSRFTLILPFRNGVAG